MNKEEFDKLVNEHMKKQSFFTTIGTQVKLIATGLMILMLFGIVFTWGWNMSIGNFYPDYSINLWQGFGFLVVLRMMKTATNLVG